MWGKAVSGVKGCSIYPTVTTGMGKHKKGDICLCYVDQATGSIVYSLLNCLCLINTCPGVVVITTWLVQLLGSMVDTAYLDDTASWLIND